MGVVQTSFKAVRKNSTGSDFRRGRINLIEGSNITLTVADDTTNNEVDVTIASSGGGTGITQGMGQAIRAGYVNTFITALS
tara:strand:+ start:1529 stop:1771 length:243 start_codon:yes stop_codon:yes gene_type:complete